MADTDDEALAWAGDEPLRAEPVKTRVVEVAPATAKPQLPAALLITYGIIAGAYLIYTIGWIVSVQRYNASFVTSVEPLNAFMFGLGEILAVAAPALWFAATLLLSRGRKPLLRLVVLLVGLIAVLPWPFVLGVWQ